MTRTIFNCAIAVVTIVFMGAIIYFNINTTTKQKEEDAMKSVVPDPYMLFEQGSFSFSASPSDGKEYQFVLSRLGDRGTEMWEAYCTELREMGFTNVVLDRGTIYWAYSEDGAYYLEGYLHIPEDLTDENDGTYLMIDVKRVSEFPELQEDAGKVG